MKHACVFVLKGVEVSTNRRVGKIEILLKESLYFWGGNKKKRTISLIQIDDVLNKTLLGLLYNSPYCI